MSFKYIYIISGGTLQHVTPHFSLCAPAYGKVGKDLQLCFMREFQENPQYQDSYKVCTFFTKMAERENSHKNIEKDILNNIGLNHLETNQDIELLVDYLVTKEDTRAIILSAALCDFKPSELKSSEGDTIRQFGKDQKRLSSKLDFEMKLTKANKIIDRIRVNRKDIFLVSFKTTSGLSKKETYAEALGNLKRSSSNLVFANDIKNKHNGVITPEEYPYWSDTREEALQELVEMTMARISLNFDRTLVLDPDIRFDIGSYDHDQSPTRIPLNFKEILQYLIDNKAFKAFNEKTSGHFGCRILETNFKINHEGKFLKAMRLCSRRKMDHNTIMTKGNGLGVVYGKDSKGTILASGGKPSVGEHTQEAIYNKFGENVHSIIHFHCPIKKDSEVPTANQREFECGSKECGDNTVEAMTEIEPGIYASHLKAHGPNIAFHKDVDVSRLIKFIESNWDLASKTGGVI